MTSLESRSSLLPESQMVQELLRPSSLTNYLRQRGLDIDDAAITYTRFKPGTGAVISMELTHRERNQNGDSQIAYLRHVASQERAAQIFAKAMTMKPRPTELGPSVRLLDQHTVLFLFPTDAKLRRLRWVSSGRKIRHLVADTFGDGPYCGDSSEISVLRYKPERRIVGKASLVPKAGGPARSFVYRLTVDSDAGKLAAINTAAREVGIATPRPIATLEDGHLHLEEALSAQPLTEWIVEHPVAPESVAEILGRIASVDTDGLVIISPLDDLASSSDALRSTLSYQPSLAREIAALEHRLRQALPEPGPLVTCHGDLHLHQFMVDHDTTYLVDWERACVGHPARDIGRLLAHPFALGLRRPDLPISALRTLVTESVDVFRQRRPIADRHLGFYLAVAFIDQALLVSRHFEHDNQQRAAAMIDMAAAVLEHGPSALTSFNPSIPTTDRNQR